MRDSNFALAETAVGRKSVLAETGKIELEVPRAAVQHGHYKTVTLGAGLRLSGLAAAKAFDRPINATLFEDWVEKCLVPTLSQGDVVVMDNLSSHKGPRVEQLIKAAGAELRYLPHYSPDMNPIENDASGFRDVGLRLVVQLNLSL